MMKERNELVKNDLGRVKGQRIHIKHHISKVSLLKKFFKLTKPVRASTLYSFSNCE